MDLSGLNPQEKDELLMQLIAKYQGGEGHPDAEQDAEQMDPVLKCIELLIGKVEELEDRLQKLECVVMDDLIGGVEKLYKGNLRTTGVKGIQDKYGHLFEPHMGAIKELEPDSDLFGSLYDLIEEARGGDPEWNDEKELASITGAATSIGEKLMKLRGSIPEGAKPEEPAVEEAPEAASVETSTVTVESDDNAPDENLMKKIRGMQAKNKASGKSSPY
jgi:hypothetical protein